MSMTARNRSTAGAFTLIEVTAALIIGAVVIAALAVTLRIAFDARDTVNAVVDVAQARLVISRTFRDDFELALRPTGGLATTFFGESGFADGLDGDRLTFDAASGEPRAAVAGSRAQRVTYELLPDSDDGSYVLVRSVQRYLLAEIEPEQQSQALVRDVRELNFRYYDGENWLDDWDAALQGNQIPGAIEVCCTFGDERRASMVEVFGLPLAASVSMEPQQAARGGSGGAGAAQGGGR